MIALLAVREKAKAIACTMLATIKAPIIQLSFLMKEIARQRIPQTRSAVIKILRREKRSEITPPKGLTRIDVTSSEI
ncbi:Uncharacterised protein [Streptococcus pneumoniae]|nr:Uncharacterised protein [Streptococcus pneumoniae]